MSSLLRVAGTVAAVCTLLGCDGQIGGVAPKQRGGSVGDDTPNNGEPIVARATPLTATRLLRRATLTLLGETPTPEEYGELLALPTEEERLAAVDRKVDAMLSSPKFYRRIVDFGHDWFRGGAYINGGNNEGLWRGDARAVLNKCEAGTKHPGALYGGYWNTNNVGRICDDQDPEGVPIEKPIVNEVTPWWAPETTVTVLGRAGTGVRTDTTLKDPDCRHVGWTIYQASLAGGSCSCGPNLVYCMPDSYSPTWNNSEAAMARQAWDEPARFLAHLAWYDRPLTDLVLANYSVAPSALQAMYVGIGRMNSKYASLDDDDSWWRPAKRTGVADPEHEAGDALAWREFVVETRNPMLLSLAGNAPSGDLSRTYTFDPRKDPGEPLGIPAAGVLTMAESFSTAPRERVRAARWLENLACRDFVPPPPTATFNVYKRDPAREGSCQYCHTTIDPAAIHFKRWTFGGGNLSMIAGLGPWRLEHMESWGTPRLRFDQEFLPNTLMTPATEEEIKANINAKLIDFLPPDSPDSHLFGQASDGTIGPLGFGKMLVKSGEFDKCATQKIYERIVGRKLDPTKEQAYIDKLAGEFVAGKRVLRTFIKTLVASPEFRGGL